MRFAITSMATNGEIPKAWDRDVVQDLRALRAEFEGLEIREGRLKGDVVKKMEIMRQCVEKVENAVYGMIVRGRERPKGWVMQEEGVRREVEGY